MKPYLQLKTGSSPLVQRLAMTAQARRLFGRGDRILVAVSGGPDSVALLSLLAALAPSWNLSLWAVHFNYGLRGDESDEDARFVADLCHHLGIKLICERITLKRCSALSRELQKRRSLQEAAREARYEALLRIGASLGANKIAIGHTADDQAETVVMWMLRGSGAAGLSGIPLERESIFIRPLLEISRRDILAYLREHGLEFRVDSSNAKPLYLRNRVRHELLPILRRFNPAVTDVLRRQAEILREEDHYLEQLVAEQVARLAREDGDSGFVMGRDDLLALPLALQRRIIRALIRRVAGVNKGPTFDAIAAILEKVIQGPSGSALTVQDVRVSRDYRVIRFRLRCSDSRSDILDAGAIDMPLPVPSTQRWPLTEQLIQTRLVNSCPLDCMQALTRSENTAMLDADRLTMDLRVRTWKPGDTFQPLGMSGQKKLQDYFADIKLPRDERRQVPLVVAPEGIVWVGGHRIDHRFRLTPATQCVLIVELLRHSEIREG
ncbi:MAG: tRNA lysidine(34) synthetase TilS [Nitrospiraceae bacterium]